MVLSVCYDDLKGLELGGISVRCRELNTVNAPLGRGVIKRLFHVCRHGERFGRGDGHGPVLECAVAGELCICYGDCSSPSCFGEKHGQFDPLGDGRRFGVLDLQREGGTLLDIEVDETAAGLLALFGFDLEGYAQRPGQRRRERQDLRSVGHRRPCAVGREVAALHRELAGPFVEYGRELKFPVVPLLRDLELEIRRLVDDVRVLQGRHFERRPGLGDPVLGFLTACGREE